MDIIIPNSQILKEAIEKERLEAEQKAKQSAPMIEGKMGDLKVWTREDILKDGKTLPAEKLAQERVDSVITSKAEMRQEDCWVAGCPHKPVVWVREIQFDLAKVGAPINISNVTTADYEGPIPALCPLHERAEQLTEAVYLDRKEMQWGFKPERAIVIYTDGSYTEIECLQIDPLQSSIIVKDEYNGNN